MLLGISSISPCLGAGPMSALRRCQISSKKEPPLPKIGHQKKTIFLAFFYHAVLGCGFFCDRSHYYIYSWTNKKNDDLNRHWLIYFKINGRSAVNLKKWTRFGGEWNAVELMFSDRKGETGGERKTFLLFLLKIGTNWQRRDVGTGVVPESRRGEKKRNSLFR